MSFIESREITICDGCGQGMVLRQARKDGSYFLGCKSFPNCRSTKKVQVGALINHLLLDRYYLNELIEEITTNDAIQRGEMSAIDDLVILAQEAKEHIENEQKKAKEKYKHYYDIEFTFG